MITNDDAAWLRTLTSNPQFDRILTHWRSLRPPIVINDVDVMKTAPRASGYEEAINDFLEMSITKDHQQTQEYIKNHED